MQATFEQTIFSSRLDFGSDANRVDLYLPILGELQSRGGFHWQQRTHALVPHVVVQGRGWMVVEGCRHEVEQGDIFFFFPHQNIEYYDAADSPWRYIWFNLQGMKARWAAGMCGVRPGAPLLKNHLTAELLDLLQRCRLALPQMRLVDSIAIAWQLIATMSHASGQSRWGKNDASHFRTLLEHPGIGATQIEELARNKGVNRSTLYRNFVRHNHCSPKAFLNRSRLQLAAELLRSGTRSIKEVAAACGYTDANYFCKAFKNCYGTTPSAFREGTTELN